MAASKQPPVQRLCFVYFGSAALLAMQVTDETLAAANTELEQVATKHKASLILCGDNPSTEIRIGLPGMQFQHAAYTRAVEAQELVAANFIPGTLRPTDASIAPLLLERQLAGEATTKTLVVGVAIASRIVPGKAPPDLGVEEANLLHDVFAAFARVLAKQR